MRFEEVAAVRKPGKKASPEAQAAYRRAQKAHKLSTAFVAMVQELRRCLDALGFGPKTVLAVGDGSFCNRTTFGQGFERTVLLTRAQKPAAVLPLPRSRPPRVRRRTLHARRGL